MTIVDQLHRNFTEILEVIPEKEISLKLVARENFRKSLLLSAASLFERQITELVTRLVDNWGVGNMLLNEFVRRKAVDRQYHTYFEWESTNANKFFGLFGDQFKAFMSKKCKSNPEIIQAIKAFMEVGRERNRLVHQDFGSYSLEKDEGEIYELYKKAKSFVDSLPGFFEEFPNSEVSE